MADCDQPLFKRYARVVSQLTLAVELKRRPASGEQPKNANMRGLTIPRLVRVESITHVGKEAVVDPTDTAEGLTAEELDSTIQTEYRDQDEELVEIRRRIVEIGIREVARRARLRNQTVLEFVNGRTAPHQKTFVRLKKVSGL